MLKYFLVVLKLKSELNFRISMLCLHFCIIRFRVCGLFDVEHIEFKLFLKEHPFSKFSCMFLNPNIFFQIEFYCPNFLDMRNVQEYVKKAFCYQKLFWPSTVWKNCSSVLKFWLFLKKVLFWGILVREPSPSHVAG